MVSNDFPIPVDGILGANFLTNTKAKIDLEKFTLKCIIEENETEVPLIHNNENITTILLPPRCEATYWLNTTHTTNRLFVPEEVCEGVFIAGAIGKPNKGKMPFRILNTRELPTYVKWVEPHSTNTEEYYILKYQPAIKERTERIKELLTNIKTDTLNNEEIEEIRKICTKYEDIFHLDGDRLTYTNISNAVITLKKEVVPKYTKPYRLPHSQKQELQKQVQKMLDDDIIEPSVSPWNSPILVVPKKKDPITGLQKLRMVIDYRKLNEQIEDDKFPLPNITDIFDMVGGATYFSCIDLSQGYYQMELDSEGRPCTAFSTETGHYQMKRLPMGLKISPSIFSRMMSIAMSGLVASRCFVYLDDLIIFGRNLHQHNRNLMDVFERLREVNLKIHPGKCSFLRKEVLYLGHILSDKGILPDPEKSRVMRDFPKPKNADEVRRFVAFANYYRKFIPNFASIALPLNKLLKKDVDFDFNNDCEKSFEIIKQILISPEILQFPDFEKEFILRTDASGFALGAVLSNHDDKPVAYGSKTLNPAERNYSTIEKELLAIVWAVKHYRPYLFGRHFKILTDHRPLVYLFSLKEPASRLIKFRLILEEYNFTVEYSPGKENCTADALSRIEVKSDELQNMYMGVITRSTTKKIQEKTIDEEIKELLQPPVEGVRIAELKIVKDFDEEFEKMQGEDIVMGPNKILAYITKKKFLILKMDNDSTTARSPTYCDLLTRDVQMICRPLQIKRIDILKKQLIKLRDGRPIKKSLNETKAELEKMLKGTGIKIRIIEDAKVVTNPEMRKLILNDYHLLPTSGHAGINRMIKNIRQTYYWTGLQQDVTEYVRQCVSCQRNKHIKGKTQPMEITTTAETSFEKIYMDLVGPLEETENGNKYILTIQDELTKFMEAVPLPNKEANTVAQGFVEKFILKYGMPMKIATDQGTEFINDVMKRTCAVLKIQQTKSTAYHHESIGALENSHKVLGTYLRSYVSPKHTDWDNWVPFYVFSYNTAIHTATGFSPFELVYGKTCKLPTNITQKNDPVYNYEDYAIDLKYKLQTAHRETRAELLKKKEERKEQYDERKKVKTIEYKPGSLVMLDNQNRKKLDPLYTGPYEVIKNDKVNCEIRYNNKNMIVHKNRVKPFYTYIIY